MSKIPKSVKEHWRDVKGNAKWDFIKWGTVAMITLLWAIIRFIQHAPIWQVIVALIITCTLVWFVISAIQRFSSARKTPQAEAESISTTLNYYFRELDATIGLLKTYKQSNAIVEAGDLVIQKAEMCNEIRKFIAKEIGPIDAAIFGAQNDKAEFKSAIIKPDFWQMSIGIFHEKLIKLKEIMQRQKS